MALGNSDVIPSIAGGGYEIENAIRFNDDDTAYLSWTPSSDGNLKKFTVSAWVKKTNPDTTFIILGAAEGNGDSVRGAISINSSSEMELVGYNSAVDVRYKTNALYRDPSAWYHVVWAIDTSLSTASNRVKLYVNGEQITSWATETQPSQDYEFANYNNSAALHTIGKNHTTTYTDGYIGEYHFIDGQQLTASDFGETGTYGEWKPIEYAGTYGTNGFYLDFGTTTNDTVVTSATGGTVSTSGDYKYHKFTSSGTFTVSSFTGIGAIETLLVAGGGGGGGNGGGGGGAGGVLYTDVTPISTGDYSITIGGGGSYGNYSYDATQGGNTTGFGLTAVGGGRGATRGASSTGGSGGSGGGGHGASGGSGTSGQGYAGGTGSGGGCEASGGGGGGAGEVGEAGSNYNPGGGGDGRYLSDFASFGESGYFGGGGAGAQTCSDTSDSGGSGGGGDVSSGNGSAGTANTGGGGGGGGAQDWGRTGANGGSGICIVRYKYQ